MHRNRSSSKRSRSPSTLPERTAVRQPDQLPEVDEETLNVATTDVDDSPPKIPPFLLLNEFELHEKFAELQRLEEERLQEKPKGPNMDARWARLDVDRVLDRYSNVQPWYHNRIQLQVPEGYNDYINASPVSLKPTPPTDGDDDPEPRIQDRYICMQGPKRETIDHVWHMIWHSVSHSSPSSPAVIIMLTPTHVSHPIDPSNIMEKCFPYYPLDDSSPTLVINENSQLGEGFKASIHLVEKEEIPESLEIEVRKLAMRVEGEDTEKIIWHLLYPMWPDFGALEEKNLDSLLALMALSREKNTNHENPRVVHCSAGVGRSGTFIALEFLLGELESGAWELLAEEQDNFDPIFDAVNQLRMQRRTMVQAYEQYAFLYQVLRNMWEKKYNVSSAPVQDQETRDDGMLEGRATKLVKLDVGYQQ
ncbi:protein-tyrosine phosphatase-like protein [Xylogone sp. PMI_703]|nr:protein-tyrosine phosphatase-like protein [Xylogone sp. PMI_703]